MLRMQEEFESGATMTPDMCVNNGLAAALRTRVLLAGWAGGDAGSLKDDDTRAGK